MVKPPDLTTGLHKPWGIEEHVKMTPQESNQPNLECGKF